MEVREEQAGDAAAIRRINEFAFGRLAEADLIEALRRAGAVAVSLVATDGGEIVGHILFTPAVVRGPQHEAQAVALGPMAVLPSRQGAGVGSMLAWRGLEVCRAQGHRVAFVLGDSEFYSRFGFERSDTYGVTCEFNCPAEAFMVFGLTGASPVFEQGSVVQYRPEFASV